MLRESGLSVWLLQDVKQEFKYWPKFVGHAQVFLRKEDLIEELEKEGFQIVEEDERVVFLKRELFGEVTRKAVYSQQVWV